MADPIDPNQPADLPLKSDPPHQGGHPPQQSHSPPQAGWPPPQPGYPPQQGAGYPPQQGYLPQGGYGQQPGYPPQQGGFPPQGYPPHPQAPRSGLPAYRIILAIAGVIGIVAGAFGLYQSGVFGGGKSEDPTYATTDSSGVAGARGSRGEREAIERVLEADSRTGSEVSMRATVTRMRAIDLADAPADFVTAYRSHIQAWEDSAQVQDVIDSFNNGSLEGARAFLLTSSAGASGTMTPEQLSVALAGEQTSRTAKVRSSFEEVTRIARDRNARIPSGSESSTTK